MANAKGKLKVFLCHATENRPIVNDLYDRLVRAGYEPWLDTEAILPGMAWDVEIKQALETSDAVIVCLSKISVIKEGYLQKELKFAQNIQLEKPDATIFLIPLRLDDGEIPYSLRSIQWADLTAPNGFEKLLASLNRRATQLKKQPGDASSSGQFTAPKPKPAKRRAKRTPSAPNVSAGDGSIIIVGDVTDSNVLNTLRDRAKKDGN